MKNKFFKKADIVPAVIILVIGLGGLLFLRAPSSENSLVEIRINGKLFDTVNLAEDAEFQVSTSRGHNTIQIKDGQVWVNDADCPGKDCMHMGKIDKEGEILLCLPHKLSIRIIGGSRKDAGSSLDGISY